MKPAWWIAETASDMALSSDARLLLIYLGTRAKGWQYSVEACLRAMCWGRQKFQRVMQEVKAAGWLSMTYERRRNGQIKRVSCVVRLRPVRTSQKAENHPSGQKHDLKAFGQKAENQPGIEDIYNSSLVERLEARSVMGHADGVVLQFGGQRHA